MVVPTAVTVRIHAMDAFGRTEYCSPPAGGVASYDRQLGPGCRRVAARPQVSTEEVWERTIGAGLPYHWCYDSYPGAKDRGGSSRCSCSACTLANHRDLLIAVQRRPRFAELCALVERVRQVPFNPNITMAELIALSRRRDAPDPGVVVEENADFERMERDVHAALRKPPTWDSKARTGPGEILHSAAGCDGCS